MTNVPASTVPEERSPAGAGLGTGQTTLLRWALRRLAFSVLILLGVSILVFAATQALPGDPAQQILGRNAAPEQLAALRKELGLNQPLVSQYWHWLRGVLTGSPGNSISSPNR